MNKLVEKSIEIIIRNQDASGAFVACPNFPTYHYSWLRDGSYIAYSMDLVGENESARAFCRWVDRTWTDAIAAGKEIMAANEGMWGVHSSIQFWEFYKKAAQNNCEFFNADQTEVLINSPECVAALEMMLSLLEEGVMPSNEEMAGVSDGDMFVNGELGMLVSGIWMFAAFESAPFSWDIQVEPGMATQATHFFANSVNVFAGTQHPEEAYQWVKFFSSDPAMAEIRINSGWELPTLNNPEYVADYLAQSPPDNRQAVFDSLEYAIVPPVIERSNEMIDAIGAALEQAVLGILTPQEALDQAKLEIEALLP